MLYLDEAGAAHCSCPGSMDISEDGLTCIEDVPTIIAANGFISDDMTWRPLLGYPDMCVIKKYSSYQVDQPFSLKTCNPTKRKSWFAYNETTGLISHGSDHNGWNQFCVRAEDGNNSRLKVAVCDANDASQVWDFDVRNAHVYLRADRKRCAVVQPIAFDDDGNAIDEANFEGWMKISNKCYTQSFGFF